MRVKRGNTRKNRRKKILKLAKGYYGQRSRAHRIAKQAVDRAGKFAYRDRRQRKRDLRGLWIVRINAAARQHGLSYSRLMAGLKKAGVGLDRKVLADLAVTDGNAFARVVEAARGALESEPATPSAPPPAATEPAGAEA
jgi:large subunit ribosomal protein L20